MYLKEWMFFLPVESEKNNNLTPLPVNETKFDTEIVLIVFRLTKERYTQTSCSA